MTYLFRTHYSIGRGIIQANDPTPDGGVLNLVDICSRHKISPCYVVDDSMAGLWTIYNSLEKANIPLVFGLRLSFVTDANDKSETSNISSHKNIVFIKNQDDYKKLIKLSSKAHTDFFHEQPRLDYKYFYENGEGLVLACDFYNGFLAKNVMSENQCVPAFKDKPPLFVENNELPFDKPLERLVRKYAAENGHEVVETQTVLYEKSSQCLAYQARRCMVREGGKQRTLEKPELPHFGSDKFCIEK